MVTACVWGAGLCDGAQGKADGSGRRVDLYSAANCNRAHGLRCHGPIRDARGATAQSEMHPVPRPNQKRPCPLGSP